MPWKILAVFGLLIFSISATSFGSVRPNLHVEQQASAAAMHRVACKVALREPLQNWITRLKASRCGAWKR